MEDSYRQGLVAVLPQLVTERWRQGCFCRSARFRKLVAFDFRDYGHTPAVLLDAEILISEVIEKQFVPLRSEPSRQASIHVYRCPQCAACFQVESEQFSVWMWCTVARAIDRPAPAGPARYLLWIHSFESFRFTAVRDYLQTDDVDDYLDALQRAD